MVSASLGWEQIGFVSKPLIVLSLVFYYFSRVTARSKVFVLGLLFCCLGDTLLLFQFENELFFMLGLGAFLIGHVFYIASNRQHRVMTGKDEFATQKVRLAFPVILAGTGLVVILYPGLGDLKVPVVLYAGVLTFMVVSAAYRLGCTSGSSFWMVFTGALLFMLSDSLLAIDKFHSHIAQASLWVMITYCCAQFMIVEGTIRHEIH